MGLVKRCNMGLVKTLARTRFPILVLSKSPPGLSHATFTAIAANPITIINDNTNVPPFAAAGRTMWAPHFVPALPTSSTSFLFPHLKHKRQQRYVSGRQSPTSSTGVSCVEQLRLELRRCQIQLSLSNFLVTSGRTFSRLVRFYRLFSKMY